MGIWMTIAAAVAAALAYFTTRFLDSRRQLRMLQRADLPMPDAHPVFGHLLILKKAAAALPADTIMHNVVWKIAREFFPGGVYYLHLWPFSQTLLIVADAQMATQVEGLGLGKGDNLVKPIETITGGPSLLTMDGATWKQWRRLFSTGFSAGYLASLAPTIADEVATFRDLLIKKCHEAPGGRSEVFQMEEMTVRMTFDVIGRVVLDTRLDYQTRDNPLAAALRSSIEWTSWRGQLNPVTKYLTIRPIVHWLNSRVMNQYIGHEIDKRFAERLRGGPKEKSGDQDLKHTSKQSKSIVSLLIDDLLVEAGSEDANHVKETVKSAMTSQLRAFLFAGHDTSSSALTYSYFLLSKHPAALDRLVAEHDAVFGAEPADALAQIHADPYKLNQLPYTTALLKETIRLFPPSGSMRVGRPGAYLVDETGRRFPTENCSVWTLSLAIHHDARYWAEPESFLPERWLVGPDDPLYPGGTTGGAASLGSQTKQTTTLQNPPTLPTRALQAKVSRIAPFPATYTANQPNRGQTTHSTTKHPQNHHSLRKHILGEHTSKKEHDSRKDPQKYPPPPEEAPQLSSSEVPPGEVAVRPELPHHKNMESGSRKRKELPTGKPDEEGADPKRNKTTGSGPSQHVPWAPSSPPDVSYYKPMPNVTVPVCGLEAGHVCDAKGEWVAIQVLRRAQYMGYRGRPDVDPNEKVPRLGLPMGQDPISTMPVFMQKNPAANLSDIQLDKLNTAAHSKKPSNGVYLARIPKKTRCGQFAVPVVDIFSPETVPRMKTYLSTDELDIEMSRKAKKLNDFEEALSEALEMGRPPPFLDAMISLAPGEYLTKIASNEVQYDTTGLPFWKLPVYSLSSKKFKKDLIDDLAELISYFPEDHLTLDVALWALLTWVGITLDEPPDEDDKDEIKGKKIAATKMKSELTAGYDREAGQSGVAKNTPVAVPYVNVVDFIVYFPHFLRFHEVNRLAFYHHPFRWISRAVATDKLAGPMFWNPKKVPQDLVRRLLDDGDRVATPFKSATPPNMRGSGLPKWAATCSAGGKLYLGKDDWGVTKCPDIRTLGVPHYNQNRYPDEGGDPFIQVAYPREWISPVFRGEMYPLPKEPRVPIPQSGPWEKVSPLPIMTTQFPAGMEMPSRSTGIEVEATISGERKSAILERAPTRSPWTFLATEVHEGEYHEYVDELTNERCYAKGKSSGSGPASRATKATSQVLRQSSAKPKEGGGAKKPRRRAQAGKEGGLAAALGYGRRRGPPPVREMSPPEPVVIKAYRKCPMFPGMESKQAGDILAPHQLSWVTTRLKKSLDILKSKGLVDKDLEVDNQKLLQHDVLDEFKNLDSFDDEWFPSKGADPKAEGEAAPAGEKALAVFHKAFKSMTQNPRGTPHPKLADFQAFFNAQFTGGPRASTKELNDAFVRSMEFFVEAEYFRHALKRYLDEKPDLYLHKRLDLRAVACHLVEYAHYQGSMTHFKRLKAYEELDDEYEEMLQTVDQEIPPILEAMSMAIRFSNTRRAKAKDIHRKPDPCGTKEQRKRAEVWEKLRSFYQRWGDPTTLDVFQEVVGSDKSIEWVRDFYEKLDKKYGYEDPKDKYNTLRLDTMEELREERGRMRRDEHEDNQLYPEEEFVEIDKDVWVLGVNKELAIEQRKESGLHVFSDLDDEGGSEDDRSESEESQTGTRDGQSPVEGDGS